MIPKKFRDENETMANSKLYASTSQVFGSEVIALTLPLQPTKVMKFERQIFFRDTHQHGEVNNAGVVCGNKRGQSSLVDTLTKQFQN